MDWKMEEALRLRKENAARAKEDYGVRSAERLERSIDKKFRTTFIGALSAFEEAFGELWGHGYPVNKLTELEKENRRLWDEVRNIVLNNGNAQLRAAKMELSEYSVEWNRYQTNFYARNSNGY